MNEHSFHFTFFIVSEDYQNSPNEHAHNTTTNTSQRKQENILFYFLTATADAAASSSRDLFGLRFTCRVFTSATGAAAAPAEGTPKPELLEEAALITFTGLLLLELEEDEEEEGWPKPMVVTPAAALLVLLPFSICNLKKRNLLNNTQ